MILTTIKEIQEDLESNSNYIFVDYNIDLDQSLKEHVSWVDRFRKSWNITIIILLTSLVYLYYIYKRDNDIPSKF